MRCTGERPRCKNCEVYDQECVFAGSARRARPTNAAINSLMEENRRLREQATTGGSHSTSVDVQEHHTPEDAAQQQSVVGSTPSSCMAPPNVDVYRDPATPIDTPRSTGGASTYHGPTSTLFDDAVRTDHQSRSWLSKEREAWMPKLLVAAAAEQRQYEGINARAGKLDFDGVEAELGLHLLNLHWNRQHHSFLVTYRPAFMRDIRFFSMPSTTAPRNSARG